MPSVPVQNPDVFSDLLESLHALDWTRGGSSGTPNGIEVSRHIVLLMREVRNLDLIWRRILDTRRELSLVDAALHVRRDPPDLDGTTARATARESHLIDELYLGITSLFYFGDTIFNRLVLLVRATLGDQRSAKYRSHTDFLKSMRTLPDRNVPVARYYDAVGGILERLDVLVGFYRDKFIVHMNYPYQQSIGRSTFLPDIEIHLCSNSLEDFDLERFKALIAKLKAVLPPTDRYGTPLEVPGDPRLKVEVLFYNLHRIHDPALKQEAEGFITSVGLTTPDIYYLANNIADAIKSSLEFLQRGLALQSATAT